MLLRGGGTTEPKYEPEVDILKSGSWDAFSEVSLNSPHSNSPFRPVNRCSWPGLLHILKASLSLQVCPVHRPESCRTSRIGGWGEVAGIWEKSCPRTTPCRMEQSEIADLTGSIQVILPQLHWDFQRTLVGRIVVRVGKESWGLVMMR